VLLADLDEAALEAAQPEVGGETAVLAADLTARDVPGRLVAGALERWGQLDVIFNNAGYNWDAPLVEMSDEQFQAMLDIHLVAPFRLLRAAGPHFREAAERDRREGVERFRKVVNVSSISGTMGNPDQANYNAAKAGVIGLTKGLAKEWGPWRVNVNAIAPGFIDTRLTAVSGEAGSIRTERGEVALGITPERRSTGADGTAIGRAGTAEEVARVVLFLASDASDYVTGQVVSVTGGVMLGMTA
jgi:3-oxoacyl-[acyl-carrier protein] reductase